MDTLGLVNCCGNIADYQPLDHLKKGYVFAYAAVEITQLFKALTTKYMSQISQIFADKYEFQLCRFHLITAESGLKSLLAAGKCVICLLCGYYPFYQTDQFLILQSG